MRDESEETGWGMDADAEDVPKERFSDRVRKAAMAGLGAVFMTEEGIRGLVKDLKLPKDAVGFFADQAERSKEEILRILGEEMRRFFRSAAFRKEALDFLSQMTIEVDAKIKLRPGSIQAKIGEIEIEGPRVKRRKAHAEPKPKNDSEPTDGHDDSQG